MSMKMRRIIFQKKFLWEECSLELEEYYGDEGGFRGTPPTLSPSTLIDDFASCGTFIWS